MPTLTKMKRLCLTNACSQCVKLCKWTSVCRTVLLKREHKVGSIDVGSHMNYPCISQAKSETDLRQVQQINFMVQVPYVLQSWDWKYNNCFKYQCQMTNGYVAVAISKTRFTCTRFKALTAMLLGFFVFWSVTLFEWVSGWLLTPVVSSSFYPWKRRHYISSKCGELLTLWHSLTSQNTWILRVYWQESFITNCKTPQP
jgi:hypothetical protein